MLESPPSPDDYLSCEFWYRSALLKTMRMEQRLQQLLDVNTSADMEVAILDQKRIGLSGEIGRVYKLFLEAEEQLSEADQLFTIATAAKALHTTITQLDE